MEIKCLNSGLRDVVIDVIRKMSEHLAALEDAQFDADLSVGDRTKSVDVLAQLDVVKAELCQQRVERGQSFQRVDSIFGEGLCASRENKLYHVSMMRNMRDPSQRGIEDIRQESGETMQADMARADMRNGQCQSDEATLEGLRREVEVIKNDLTNTVNQVSAAFQEVGAMVMFAEANTLKRSLTKEKQTHKLGGCLRGGALQQLQTALRWIGACT